MSSNARIRADRGSRICMMVISGIVIALIVVLLIKSNGLKKKISMYETLNGQLQEAIVEEQARSGEIAKLPAYIHSDEYIEKVAREKFHLVYEDEIIFVAGSEGG